MTRFVQLHLLTFFPPSNPNRDDQGRPKTCVVGGTDRLRISSQSAKRAVRTSPAFAEALAGHLGRRTARLGDHLIAELVRVGHDDESATAHAHAIAGVFGGIVGAPKKGRAVAAGIADADEVVQSDVLEDNPVEEAPQAAATKGGRGGRKPAATAAPKPYDHTDPTRARITTLAYVTQEEWDAAMALARSAVPGSKPDVDRAKLLRKTSPSVDVALFGRMFAAPEAFEYRFDAAAQVSHAFTTSSCRVDTDYYTALDDLTKRDEEGGAGFLDTAFHGSGVYYQYVCVDVDQLLRNLGPGHEELARIAIRSLVQGFATVSPSGKRNSFAHNTRAAYVMAEVGSAQPRSLAQAFLRPVAGGDLMERSIEALTRTMVRFDEGYGACADARSQFDVYRDPARVDAVAGTTTMDRLDDLGRFCADTVGATASALTEAA